MTKVLMMLLLAAGCSSAPLPLPERARATVVLDFEAPHIERRMPLQALNLVAHTPQRLEGELNDGYLVVGFSYGGVDGLELMNLGVTYCQKVGDVPVMGAAWPVVFAGSLHYEDDEVRSSITYDGECSSPKSAPVRVKGSVSIEWGDS